MMKKIATTQKHRSIYMDDEGMVFAECTYCRKNERDHIKPITEFHKNKRLVYGINLYCKECCKVLNKPYQKAYQRKKKL